MGVYRMEPPCKTLGIYLGSGTIDEGAAIPKQNQTVRIRL